jgi:hypothetical protein
VLVVAAVVATGVVADDDAGVADRVDEVVGDDELPESAEPLEPLELPEFDEPFELLELGDVEVELDVLCLTGSTYCWSPAEPPPLASAATGRARASKPTSNRPTSRWRLRGTARV